MVQLTKLGFSKLVDTNEVAQIGDQGVAITAAAVPTEITSVTTGQGTTVTSVASTDLDTAYGDLVILENEVTALSLVVNKIISALEAHGLIANN